MKTKLQAKNLYSEDKPKPGAVAFTVVPRKSGGSVICLRIEGDTWETELSFQVGDGTMWIYPPSKDD